MNDLETIKQKLIETIISEDKLTHEGKFRLAAR